MMGSAKSNRQRLRACTFRYPPDVRVFRQQLVFRLQPVINIMSIDAATFNVDLIRAQPNFLMRGMQGFLCGSGIGQHIFCSSEGFAGNGGFAGTGERHSPATDIKTLCAE
jgi:hypothetical protein